MKLLVCGGRDFDDEGFIHSTLFALRESNPFHLLIHGNARGADRIAGEWARSQYGVQEVVCPANWYLHGNRAGFMRNQAMLELGPDIVLAFPGGTGTRMMVKLAKEANIDLVIESHEVPYGERD